MRAMKLKWKFSLDENVLYNLYIEINKNRFKLKSRHFENFTNEIIHGDKFKIKIFEKDNEIFIVKKLVG